MKINRNVLIIFTRILVLAVFNSISAIAQLPHGNLGSKIKHKKQEIALGALFFTDGWGISFMWMPEKKNKGFSVLFREYIHRKEQKQINKDYVQLLPQEKVSPFYFKKIAHVYELSLGWNREQRFYTGQNFFVYFQGGLEWKLLMSKPVYYTFISSFPDSSGAYLLYNSTYKEALPSHRDDYRRYLNKDPFYRNWKELQLFFAGSGRFEFGCQISINSFFSNRIAIGGELIASTRRILTLEDYPKSSLFLTGYFSYRIVF